MISIIVAKSKNNAIGKNNKMLWHISDDLKYFKRVTMGHPVIMGYNTWVSLGCKPLPGRKNVVVSRSHKAEQGCGADFFSSLETAIIELSYLDEEIFIIGGGQIYKSAMPFADKLYITIVDVDIAEADAFFPEIDYEQWEESSPCEKKYDVISGYNYSVQTYSRK